MKKMSSLLLIIFLLAGATTLQAQKTIEIKKEPSTVEEFINLRNKTALTTEGGVVMFLLALKIYSENPELGEKLLVLSVDKSVLMQGDIYKGYQLRKGDMNLIKRQLAGYKNIANSYIKGANPKNGYNVKLPYIYKLSENAYCGNRADGRFKNFVKCYGADSPRPIHIKKNNKGIWKATNWSSVITGIKKIELEEDDDL